MRTTFQSDVGRIRRLMIKHARDAFVDDDVIDRQWQPLNYRGRPDLQQAVDEYERFAELLRSFDIELDFLPRDDSVGLDSLYPRDAAIATDKGMILCSMGKDERRTEPSAIAAAFRSRNVPILGSITGTGRIEGGDVTWLDRDTLVVGRGYRTNDEGIRQLRRLLDGSVENIVTVSLPHWRGPDDVFHLMSMISPVTENLAVVYAPLLPVSFREFLVGRGMRLVEVPDEEFESQGCNVLTVAPGVCILRRGNPKTRERLAAAGAEIHEFDGDEICGRGAGGPTCLTRPTLREVP